MYFLVLSFNAEIKITGRQNVYMCPLLTGPAGIGLQVLGDIHHNTLGWIRLIRDA
jgi:hypothetical protein